MGLEMIDQNNIVSLGRVRADRTDASGWTPREAVVEMLRMIDEGLSVERLIICYDGIQGAGFQNATENVMDAVGLLQVTQLEIVMAGRE